MPRQDDCLPERFCWTRFGTEAGEGVGSILARKERERLTTGGLFLWGVGNSVGPGIRDLVCLEHTPWVLFSPMRSKPKTIDARPSQVLVWTTAADLGGTPWSIPEGVTVTSRGVSEGGRPRQAHYALVCRLSKPLDAASEVGALVDQSLVNLQSQNKVGNSQVTAVVQRRRTDIAVGTTYPVAFIAELVFPYFVRLGNPCTDAGPWTAGPDGKIGGLQRSLFAL